MKTALHREIDCLRLKVIDLERERDEARDWARRLLSDTARLRDELDTMRPHTEGCNWRRRGDAYPCSCMTGAALAAGVVVSVPGEP